MSEIKVPSSRGRWGFMTQPSGGICQSSEGEWRSVTRSHPMGLSGQIRRDDGDGCGRTTFATSNTLATRFRPSEPALALDTDPPCAIAAPLLRRTSRSVLTHADDQGIIANADVWRTNRLTSPVGTGSSVGEAALAATWGPALLDQRGAGVAAQEAQAHCPLHMGRGLPIVGLKRSRLTFRGSVEVGHGPGNLQSLSLMPIRSV